MEAFAPSYMVLFILAFTVFFVGLVCVPASIFLAGVVVSSYPYYSLSTAQRGLIVIVSFMICLVCYQLSLSFTLWGWSDIYFFLTAVLNPSPVVPALPLGGGYQFESIRLSFSGCPIPSDLNIDTLHNGGVYIFLNSDLEFLVNQSQYVDFFLFDRSPQGAYVFLNHVCCNINLVYILTTADGVGKPLDLAFGVISCRPITSGNPWNVVLIGYNGHHYFIAAFC